MELLAQLAVLALIDGTSIGTLVIPAWLLLRPGRGGSARAAVGRAAMYLAILAVFYYVIGLALMSGSAGLAGAMGKDVAALAELPAVRCAMLLAGCAMLAWALSSGKGPRRAAVPALPFAVSGAAARPAGRWQGSRGETRGSTANPAFAVEHRWQARIGRAVGTPWGLLGLALMAGVLELPTMLPYLAAVGLLTASGAGWFGSAAALGAYCLVMLLPAALLLGARLMLGRHLDRPLERVAALLSKVAGEAVLWVVGIVGFLLLRHGLAALFPDAGWNPFG
ncbi:MULTISPECIES: GAP family protein [unclassified Pseudarthrobacter]|uniref:GAP family protein n=1 Tax=unclassified Pseudarthrobacter TaxID=2647000 RepID=UPI003626A78D